MNSQSRQRLRDSCHHYIGRQLRKNGINLGEIISTRIVGDQILGRVKTNADGLKETGCDEIEITCYRDFPTCA